MESRVIVPRSAKRRLRHSEDSAPAEYEEGSRLRAVDESDPAGFAGRNGRENGDGEGAGAFVSGAVFRFVQRCRARVWGGYY